MLTRKQLWRRAQTNLSSNQKGKSSEFDSSGPRTKMGRAFSEPIDTSRALNIASLGDRVKSSNDIIGSSKKKHVQFSGTSKVVLIPCRKEYHTHRLHQDLWWESEDYHQFKRSAAQEISNLVQCGGDLKTILKTKIITKHE